ncbi:BlaI/MecI/CopY family transcriptional regulator [Streptomyces sp. NPDC002516]
MSGKGRDGRRPHGELVADVLAVLWKAGKPLTAHQVNEVLDKGLARTTTSTILSRLYEKGTLRRRPTGRSFAYEPVEDAAGLVAGRMRRELESEPRRDLVLQRFVSSLSEGDEETLRRLLREAEGGEAEGGEAKDGGSEGDPE